MRGSAQALHADPEGGLAEFDVAHATFAALAAAEPENAMFARELTMTRARMALLRTGIGDGEVWFLTVRDDVRAEADLRDAVARAEALATADTEDTRAALRYRDMAVDLALFLTPRDAPAALEVFTRADRITATRLGQKGAVSFDLPWYTDCAMAWPLALAGRRDEALARLDRGMVDAAKGQAGSLEDRLHLPGCRYFGGLARRALGEDPAAAALWTEALSDLRPLVAERPLTVKPYAGILRVSQALSEVRPTERCSLLTEARQALEAWPGAVTAALRRERAGIESALAGCPP